MPGQFIASELTQRLGGTRCKAHCARSAGWCSLPPQAMARPSTLTQQLRRLPEGVALA